MLTIDGGEAKGKRAPLYVRPDDGRVFETLEAATVEGHVAAHALASWMSRDALADQKPQEKEADALEQA